MSFLSLLQLSVLDSYQPVLNFLRTSLRKSRFTKYCRDSAYLIKNTMSSSNRCNVFSHSENTSREHNTECSGTARVLSSVIPIECSGLKIQASHNKCVDTNAELKSLRDERNILQSAAETDRVRFHNNLDSQKQIIANKYDEIKRIGVEKEKEVSQLKITLDERRDAYLSPANNYAVMEKELSAKDKAAETLQHQLTQAQAEIEKLKGAHVGERTTSLGTGHGTEAQQDRQTQGTRDPGTDDMAPDSGDGQQISRSRKRKAGDTGSDSRTGELHPRAGSCSGNNTTPGLSADRQDPSTRNLSNLTIANLRDPTYVPDPPIPAEVLSRLRENLHGWDRRKVD